VAHAGRDENGGHPAHRDEFAVEFHVALAFEDQVDRLSGVIKWGQSPLNHISQGSTAASRCVLSPGVRKRVGGGRLEGRGWIDD
jgi:hypothetical protein